MDRENQEMDREKDRKAQGENPEKTGSQETEDLVKI
jgi:hypothetical protein